MLQGKNAIVTGARTGIGKAIVYKLAQSGANVWAIVHRDDQDWLEEMQMLGMVHNVWIKPVFIDLSDEKSIIAGMKQIISEKQPIDILVNAAGILSPKRLFSMTSLTDIRKVMDVNYYAAIHLSQLVARLMMRQKSGSIVNISSMSAWGDDEAQLEYACSKAALNIATKKMAKELGPYGIRVNAIAPGLIQTKMLEAQDEQTVETLKSMTSVKRIGKPAEVADLVAYLSSDNSQYITGQTIRIDGGI